jgi:hypothetical protein
MSLLAATVLTAIATAVLAVFAIITAWYARKAFLKQSQEVAAIERQVTDEQELTRQQAELLKVQTGQLAALQGQLEEQRKAGTAQAEVLKLQASELQESLKERERQAEQARRSQAARVFLTDDRFKGRTSLEAYSDSTGAGPRAPSVTATVHNTSDQPIYDAEFLWRRGSASHCEPNPEPIGILLPGEQHKGRREFPSDTNWDVSGAILPPEWFTVAAWLAGTHHQNDAAQQKRVITGHVLRRAMEVTEGGWRDRYRDSRHLSETVQAILERHLPLAEG